MNNIDIAATQCTPGIHADWDSGVLILSGESYPEHSFKLFSPIIEWVDHYLSSSSKPLSLELSLIYLNTSSIKVMMDIFDRLEEAHHAGHSIKVEWVHDPDDECVENMAAEFKEDCTFPFVISILG